jgi:molybdenum cofactor biosynthesis enzyme MoaA
VERARRQRTARIELDGADPLTPRCAHPGPRPPPLTPAAALTALAATDAATRVLAVARPDLRADLATLIAAARGRPGPVVLECEPAGLTPEVLGLGLDRARVVVGGVRAKVHAAVLRTDAPWPEAAAHLAAAVVGATPIEVVVPLVTWNQDDLVPLVEWLAALPGRLARLAIALPAVGQVPSPAHRLLLDQPRAAAVVAAALTAAHAARLPAGLDGEPLWPCADDGALDRFATVFHDGLRRLAAEPDRPRVRIAACGACAVADACPGLDAAYHARFGATGLTAVPKARAAAWRLRPTRGGGEVEYAQISPFANLAAGRGRGLVRVNGHCQMACAFCFVDRGKGDLPLATIAAEIDAIAGTQRDHLVVSGGEPTLHPDLPAILAHARAAGFATVEVQTNGVRCADRTYAASLVAAGLTKATVSLHSMDPATSDAITRLPGAFPRTVAGLHQLADLGVEVQLAHVISRDNFAALPAFTAAMLAEFAGPGRHLSVCFALAQAVSDLVPRWILPTFTEIKPYVRAALDACDAAGVGYGGLIGQGGYPPCALDGELRYYRGVLDKIFASADADAQFAKAPQCARCDFDRRCLGVRRDYLERHGADELVPFTIAPTEAAALPPPPRDPTLVALGRRR